MKYSGLRLFAGGLAIEASFGLGLAKLRLANLRLPPSLPPPKQLIMAPLSDVHSEIPRIFGCLWHGNVAKIRFMHVLN